MLRVYYVFLLYVLYITVFATDLSPLMQLTIGSLANDSAAPTEKPLLEVLAVQGRDTRNYHSCIITYT